MRTSLLAVLTSFLLGTATAGAGVPVSCNPGEGYTAPDTCTTCFAGFYSPGGTSPCLACAPGTYGFLPGQASCSDCPLGRFTSTSGSTVCAQCSSGTFSGSTGQSACDDCGAGTFAAGAGSSSCSACSPGTFAGSTGQSACDVCNAGTFAANSGSVACSPCSAGTFSSTPGATSCAGCAEGFYSTTLASTTCLACECAAESCQADEGCVAAPVPGPSHTGFVILALALLVAGTLFILLRPRFDS